MVTDKLAKEFEKIRTSLAKSKKLILADIDKIDEKYRRLAQEEKKSLTESLGVLNEQLKYYDNMLEGVPEDPEDVPTEDQKEEEEPVIQDTIFPENNEPEEPEKQEEVKEVEVNTDAVVTEDVPQPEEEKKEEQKDEKPVVEDIPQLSEPDWSDPNNVKTDDEGWPQW